MKKYLKILLAFVLLLGVVSALNQNDFIYASEIKQNDKPIQNHSYSTIDKNGNVQIHEYEKDQTPITIESNQYQVVTDEGEIVNTYDTYEQANQAISKNKKISLFGLNNPQYEIQAIADTKDITYGVARIIGFVQYKEVDRTGTGRVGYTHGTSANDAAYISTSGDGKRIRVKQAGVVMDIPAENVFISEYTNNSNVSYYMGKNGILYHYYYSGTYGSQSILNMTQVGYTPAYLKDNVKYYSYDGHYFYNSYITMIDDYRANVAKYPKAINASQPYYNYYQYLSLRSSTYFTANDFNKLITDQKGENTKSKLKNQGQSLLNNEQQYGINASLMLGVAINESAWGLSKYSQDRNNLFGIGAVDSNPDAALRFESVEKCFNYFAYNTISAGYLDCEDYRYRGPHLGDKQSGINTKYASDPYWGEKAASFGYRLNQDTNNKDYQKYALAIANTDILKFYEKENLTNHLFNSGAVDKTNEYVYSFPVTILSENTTTYKILSDTVLTSDRKNFNVDGNFDKTRDYVFIKKTEVDKVIDAQQEYLMGDVNGDKKIDSMDMYLVIQHILGESILKDSYFKAADTNKDEKLDSMDMYNIIQIILKA